MNVIFSATNNIDPVAKTYKKKKQRMNDYIFNLDL